MIDIVVYLSLGVFLLLPFYLAVFLPKKRTTYLHIALWIIVNLIMTIIFYIVNESIYVTPVLVLGFLLLYYFFTYIFYVKEIQSELKKDESDYYAKIKYFTKMKYFNVILNVVLGLIFLLLILIITLLSQQMKIGHISKLEMIYFVTILFISYTQLIYYTSSYKGIR